MVTESSLMTSVVALITPTAKPVAPEAAFVVLVVAGVATKSHSKNPIWLAFPPRRYAVVLWPSSLLVISLMALDGSSEAADSLPEARDIFLEA